MSLTLTINDTKIEYFSLRRTAMELTVPRVVGRGLRSLTNHQ